MIAPNGPRHCERSEAIQSCPRRMLDCFVADAPRNDGHLDEGDGI